MNVGVIVPSYNPNEQLVDVVRALSANGFNNIIVVNDGSNEAHMEPFQMVSQFIEVTLLTHPVNCGKGRALKTAFAFCTENCPDLDGVITVDGDNQHQIQDIIACVKAMEEHPDQVILGCRDFSLDYVPWKSRVGNHLTSGAFRIFCGIKLSDTQTGLRGFPMGMLPFLLEVPGERFEYETRMLLEMKKAKYTFFEVPISTIYIEDNSETHFNPFKDTIKISLVIIRYTFGRLLRFLKFSLGSILSFLIDIGVFYLVEYLVGGDGNSVVVWSPLFAANTFLGAFLANALGNQTHFISTVASRVTSSVFNYCFNRNLVFKKSSNHSIWKYYILALVQMILSGLLVTLAAYAFKTAAPWQSTIIKMVVDSLLFITSYQVQKRWVFAPPKNATKEK